MRPVLHGDVCAAARVLLNAPALGREVLCRRMIAEAEVADRHVQRAGQMHPLFGNGSLMSAARKRVLADEPGFDNRDYCLCFETVLRVLIARALSRESN